MELDEPAVIDSNPVIDETTETHIGETSICPGCGKAEASWGGSGQGFRLDDAVYCCGGCANQTGCTCAAVASGLSSRFATG